jgi:hypothetical protein
LLSTLLATTALLTALLTALASGRLSLLTWFLLIWFLLIWFLLTALLAALLLPTHFFVSHGAILLRGRISARVDNRPGILLVPDRTNAQVRNAGTRMHGRW